MSQSDFNKEVESESAKSLVQLVLSIFKQAKSKILDEAQIHTASKNYLDNYITRNGYVKVLGMFEPRPIQDIYTNVIIIYPSYLTKEKEIESLEQNFKESKRKFIDDPIISGIQVANEKNKLNILGPPGSGKSTFLKRVGLLALLNKLEIEARGERFEHSCIPVLIELKKFRNEAIDLQATIQKEFEIAGFPNSSSFVEKALKKGSLLILLDGLDEVPKDKLDATIEHIRDFTDKYKKNRYITSCRTAFYKTYFKSFIDIEIAPFNNKQIKNFIRNWFYKLKDHDSDVYSRFTNLLFEQSHKQTLELARTPLLLTFLCLTFDESQKFPANRSSLYKQALYILLEKWAAEKRIHNDDIYQNFSSDLEVQMLAEISANFYIKNKIFFYSDELKKCIKTFLDNSTDIKTMDISRILEAIEVQQGLLVQRASDIYSFSHLTIQEYLTAYYFNTPSGIDRLTCNYLLDKRWREVFLLLAGIGQSDDMLLIMMRHLNRYIATNKIYSQLKAWINSLLLSSADYELDACKRVFLASIVLQSVEDPNIFSTIKRVHFEKYINPLLASLNNSFAKSYSLKKSLNSKNNAPVLHLVEDWTGENFGVFDSARKKASIKSEHIGVHNKAIMPFFIKLNVPQGILFKNKSEYEKLLNYLEAYTLIIDCKKGSLRLTKDTWKTICSNLLH